MYQTIQDQNPNDHMWNTAHAPGLSPGSFLRNPPTSTHPPTSQAAPEDWGAFHGRHALKDVTEGKHLASPPPCIRKCLLFIHRAVWMPSPKLVHPTMQYPPCEINNTARGWEIQVGII